MYTTALCVTAALATFIVFSMSVIVCECVFFNKKNINKIIWMTTTIPKIIQNDSFDYSIDHNSVWTFVQLCNYTESMKWKFTKFAQKNKQICNQGVGLGRGIIVPCRAVGLRGINPEEFPQVRQGLNVATPVIAGYRGVQVHPNVRGTQRGKPQPNTTGETNK